MWIKIFPLFGDLLHDAFYFLALDRKLALETKYMYTRANISMNTNEKHFLLLFRLEGFTLYVQAKCFSDLFESQK